MDIITDLEQVMDLVAAPPAYPKYGKGCTCTLVRTVASQAWNLYD